MNTVKMLETVMLNAEIAIKTAPSDYIGENGLLYCGKCNTPKQCKVDFFGEIRTPKCLCKCEMEKRDAEDADRKRAERERNIARNRREGFPQSEMAAWTFENDDGENEKVTNAMLRYVDNFAALKRKGKGLLLYGTLGTGKTFAACEVANALIDKGYRVLVTNFARLTNTIQGMFEGKQEFIDDLNRYSLIVIDDLGAERKSDFMQEMVYSIIDSRYRAGLPMIITTNLTIEEIKRPENIGNSRIYDRIIERCFPIECSGGSRRRKAVREEYEEMKALLGL